MRLIYKPKFYRMKQTIVAVLAGLFMLPIVAFAAYNDVVFTSVNVMVNGITVVVQGANTESVTVNDSSFSFVLEPNSSLSVVSPDGYSFSHNAAPQYVGETSCSGGSSSVEFISSASETNSTTITVTPSTTLCSGSSSLSSSGGGIISSGGSGGGGSYTPPTPPSAVNPIPAAPEALLHAAVSAAFNRTLRPGITSVDVKRLQQLLVLISGVYPEGKVTGFYGSLTQKAVQRFQAKYNIVTSGTPSTTGFGALGPKTRAKLLELFGN